MLASTEWELLYRIWFFLVTYVLDTGFCSTEQTDILFFKIICAFCQNERSDEVKEGTSNAAAVNVISSV